MLQRQIVILLVGVRVLGREGSKEVPSGSRSSVSIMYGHSRAGCSAGHDDAEFDCVVSVNNVAIWPDLQPGLSELHRVTRTGGRVLIAWHGGLRPSRIARSLALPEDKLAHIDRGLRSLFSRVTRHELVSLTIWAAVR